MTGIEHLEVPAHERDVAARTVADVMTRDVVTTGPDVGFQEAVRLITARHVDALPVVEDTGRLVGLVSESDLLLKEELYAEQGLSSWVPWRARRDQRRAGASTVQGVMTRDVVTTTPGATLHAAARLMHRHRVGGLPVVDAKRHVVGIVTRSDLLRVFLREDGDVCADITEALGEQTARSVTCDVQGGRVHLAGRVPLRSQAMAATAAARRVPGVVEVESRLAYDRDDVDVAMVGP